MRVRLGSALFNADHGRLADELRRADSAGIDFFHFDIFDGTLVPDLAFPPRTMEALRPLTKKSFEVHLVSAAPLKHLPALKHAGADLVFLPAEACPMMYESIYAVKELKLRVGLCLALGTPLETLWPVLPLLDSVLLLARVTGEGTRGRKFNPLVLDRVRAVRAALDTKKLSADLQAAGGLEHDNASACVAAGARALPLGGGLHREKNLAAYVKRLRVSLASAL